MGNFIVGIIILIILILCAKKVIIDLKNKNSTCGNCSGCSKKII